MAEAAPAPATSSTSSPGEPSPTTAASSSSPSATTPPPKKGPDPAKVKAILEHANGTAAAATDAAAASAGEPSIAKKTGSPPKDGAPSEASDGDPALALRLARIAQKEDAARAATKEAEAVKGELAEYRGWKEARAKDPVAAALHGLTPEQRTTLYWHLNEDLLKNDPATPPDPAEVARKAAREELERINGEREGAQTKQRQEAEAAAVSRYTSDIAQVFQADPKKWPAVAARGVSEGDIHSYAEAEYKRTGAVPDAAAVLDHFQRAYEAELEAQGYTRQKVEAQPGGTKPKPQSDTVTNEWSAGSVPTSDGRGEQSLHEAREAIKRKHFRR